MPKSQYAKAFLEVINYKEDVAEQFFGFVEAIDSEFSTLMDSPRINREEKKKIVKEVLKGANDDVVNFIYVLLDNNRFELVSDIKLEVNKFLNEKLGIADVEIRTPNKLTKDEVSELESSLAKRINKKVKANIVLDETLIAGIKVFYEGKSLDNSVISRLNNMKARLNR